MAEAAQNNKVTIKFRRWRKMPDLIEEREWAADPEHDGVAHVEFGELDKKMSIPPGIKAYRTAPGIYEEAPFGIYEGVFGALMQAGVIKDFRIPIADAMDYWRMIPDKGRWSLKAGADGYLEVKFIPPSQRQYPLDPEFLDDLEIGCKAPKEGV